MGFYSSTIPIYFICFHSQAAQISGSDDLMLKTHNSESELLLSLSRVSSVFGCFMPMWEKQARPMPPASPSLIEKMCFVFFSLSLLTTVGIRKNEF